MKKLKLFKTTIVLVVIALTAAALTACGTDGSAGTAGTVQASAGEGASVTQETAAQSTTSAAATEQQAGSVETPASNYNTNRAITVVSREEGSGTRGAFVELFGVEVKNEEGKKIDMTTLEANIINSTNVVLTTIAENPYAIGYVSIGSLNSSVKALAIDGVHATSENVKKGSYTIVRPFNIATKGGLSAVTEDFIGFILSAEGQEVASGSYVAVNDAAAQYAGSKPEGKIVVGGSSSVGPLMEKLIEAYAVINPNASIELQITDSSAGMNGAIEGTLDIGMASRALSENENNQLDWLSIALDGVAVIVSPDNPLNDASKEEIRRIFTGEVAVWSEIIN